MTNREEHEEQSEIKKFQQTLDRRAMKNLFDLVGIDYETIEFPKVAGISGGHFSRLWSGERNRAGKPKPTRVRSDTLKSLADGIAKLAKDYGAPFPVWEDLLVISDEHSDIFGIVTWFITHIAEPACSAFFAELSNDVRRMSLHNSVNDATQDSLEGGIECLQHITPSYYQGRFVGGSYLINSEGTVSAAYTPLDPDKEQLRGESVSRRPYMQPALELADHQGGYISNRLTAIDPSRDSIPIIVVIANICRGSSQEVLGAVDVVVDVEKSPLADFIKILAEKLRTALPVEESHPVTVAVLDRNDQPVASYSSPEGWGQGAGGLIEKAAVISRHVLLSDVKLSLLVIDGAICCAVPLDAVPGFVLLVAVQKPD